MKVLAATRNDMNEGWVWLSETKLPPRSIVKIQNKNNKKTIYCEGLKIDSNFIKEYNQSHRININPNEPTAVINGWYRSHLGNIETKQKHELIITEVNSYWGKLRACTDHPQIIVRLATWLAVLSVALGALSIFLALVVM